jgi:dTDP-4-dehydrorhamnose reductase
MVYISTGGVFDGEKAEPYTEFDAPAPRNVYGHAKLAGERLVRQHLRKYFIVRAGWMIGGGPAVDKKFVGKILHLIREGTPELQVVNDKFGSPTFAKDFAASLSKIAATGVYGLYHRVNGGGAVSRYDIALEIVRLVKAKTKVTPVPSSAFPLPAPRARSEALRNFRLDLMGLNDARPWKEALAEYVAEWGAA